MPNWFRPHGWVDPSADGVQSGDRFAEHERVHFAPCLHRLAPPWGVDTTSEDRETILSINVGHWVIGYRRPTCSSSRTGVLVGGRTRARRIGRMRNSCHSRWSRAGSPARANVVLGPLLGAIVGAKARDPWGTAANVGGRVGLADPQRPTHIDTAKRPCYGSEGWGFESLRARRVETVGRQRIRTLPLRPLQDRVPTTIPTGTLVVGNCTGFAGPPIHEVDAWGSCPGSAGPVSGGACRAPPRPVTGRSVTGW